MLQCITFPRQLYAAKFKGRRFYELYQIRLLRYMCDIIIVTIDIHSDYTNTELLHYYNLKSDVVDEWSKKS